MAVSRFPALDQLDHRHLGVEEHAGAAVKRLFAEVVEDIGALRRDQHVFRDKAVEVAAVDFRPVGCGDIGKDDIERRVVIADEDIAVVHRRRVHVRMVVDDAERWLRRIGWLARR